MLANLVRIMRLRAGSKAIVVGIAAAALVALAGGWAFASLRPGHVTASTGTPASAAVRSAGSAANAVSPNVGATPARQSRISQTGQPQGAAAAPLLKLPAGLLLARPQTLAEIVVPGNAGSAGRRSATGGGSAQFFHFGFTAQPHLNGNVAGTVTGNAEVIFGAPNPGTLHIDINCLEIVGNDAYMSGTLAKAAFGLTKGTEMLFGVQHDDSAATADLISDIYFSPAPPFTCHTFHAKPHYAVHGNIEIH
jgi:hypothetical protein